MADQVVNYQCAACCGTLRFDAASGKLVCDYCDSVYEVAEVEAQYKEKEERAAKAQAEQASESWSVQGLGEDWGEDSAKMKSYICPSCAAELICDETTAATCCPYCGNQTVVPGQFSGALRPEFVIPFKKDKEAAIAALKSHYKGKKLLPKDFASGNHVEDIQGVYVPFWLFDAEGDGDMSFHTTTSQKTRNGNVETTTTKHYDVRRKGKVVFEKVPTDASTRMPDGHMDSIEPFDYSELTAFSTAYMPGYLADKYDVEAETCGPRMEERCTETVEQLLTESVQGYETTSVKEKNIIIRKGDVHYAMLPVWLLATKWNDQSFLFAMNGQTGKMVGDLPVDKKKYYTYLCGISAALIAIMLFISYVVMAQPFEGATMAICCFLLPILIGFLVASGMKAQLKSVHKQQAAAYVNKNGLKLDIKTDTYVRTTVEKRTIQTSESK